MENYIYKIYIGQFRNYAKYEIDFGKCSSRSRRGNVWEDWEPMIAKELDFFSAIEPEILEFRNNLFHVRTDGDSLRSRESQPFFES